MNFVAINDRTVRHALLLVLLLAAQRSPTVQAADTEVPQLVTSEMQAQIAPALRERLERASQLVAFDNGEAALALLGPLQLQAESGALNYWETFEVFRLVGEAHSDMRNWQAARDMLEKCLNFTDIDSYRRRQALTAAAKVYVRLKEAERALAAFEELNGMNGGKDPYYLAEMAQVYQAILRDRATAISYLEAAIENDGMTPARGRLLLLRRAYVLDRQLAEALNVAKRMVELYGYPSDASAMDDIITAMNRQLR